MRQYKDRLPPGVAPGPAVDQGIGPRNPALDGFMKSGIGPEEKFLETI
jgi:hypothetical protein